MLPLTFQTALGLTALTLAAGCTGQASPAPSKVTTPYGVKADDVVREAATVVLVTTREVVIAAKCPPAGDPASVDRLVAQGLAARLPANVTLYTTPYEPLTLDSLPDVVTDDGYSGKLCTPHAFSLGSPAPER